jgi:hypothetical protein
MWRRVLLNLRKPHFESTWPERRSFRLNSSIVGEKASSRVGKVGPMNAALSLNVISPSARIPSLLASAYVYVRLQRPNSGYPGSLRCVLRLPVNSAETPGARLFSSFLFVEAVRMKLAPKALRSITVWFRTNSRPRFSMLPMFSNRVAIPATEGAMLRLMIASLVSLS